jgi:trimeric autotransporter adhesin
MNENALRRIGIPADDSRLRANWWAVHAFNGVNSNQMKKMKNLTRSMNRSPLRCGYFTLAIALCWFALSPPLKAQCPSDCGAGGNTAVGVKALDSVTTGINNTAVGTNALQDNTTGFYNVAIGSGALASNTTGDFNMAIGAGALLNNNANFNLAVGFRTCFLNTTGNHLTGIGAAAMRNNTTGGFNTAIGADALRENATGSDNTAIGSDALSLNTVSDNTAIGSEALASSTNSPENVAVGFRALASTSGSNGFNVAVGFQALDQVTTGGQNTAVGDNALGSLVTGTLNTALGDFAGISHTGGDSGNVDIGAFETGVSGESNVTRIANIGTTAQVSGVFVTVNAVGGTKLGFQVSSRRYKEDIKPMEKASESLFALTPVTFRYKKDMDPSGTLQYGLIAEDVAKVNPDLVLNDPQGKPATLRFLNIQAMMLNEFLKEHKKVEEQQASIAELKSTVAQQQKGMEVLTAQLKEQAAQIQKVSAQLEASKPTPKVVANQ